LLENGRRQAAVKGTADEIDFWPVVKLFTPDGAANWLLTELDADGDAAFCLCDLGIGHPELGCMSLAESNRSRQTRLAGRTRLVIHRGQAAVRSCASSSSLQELLTLFPVHHDVRPAHERHIDDRYRDPGLFDR
jgi:hypothetical protein